MWHLPFYIAIVYKTAFPKNYRVAESYPAQCLVHKRESVNAVFPLPLELWSSHIRSPLTVEWRAPCYLPRDLEEALEMGVDWSLREGYAWAEDKEHCEEYGRMLQADPNKVSARAKKRGLPQVTCNLEGEHIHIFQLLFFVGGEKICPLCRKYMSPGFFTVYQKSTNLFVYASFLLF